MTLDPKEIPLPKLHQLLLGAIAPRPIAFVSTMNKDGKVNLSPFSFFNVFSANPPIAIFSPARRGRDNTTKHTYENAKELPECVINVVSYDIVQHASIASAEYPEDINEFDKAGLTAIASVKVRPPRVKESPVQLECIIRSVTPLGENGGAGNLVMCEIVMIHVDDHVLDENGQINPGRIDQVARMGGAWYTRARAGLFELPQPTTRLCVGVDSIPESVRKSHILSGYNLGQLGSVFQIPDETSVNEYKLIELADTFLANEDNPPLLERKLHQHARQLLAENKIDEAWKTLLAFNH